MTSSMIGIIPAAGSGIRARPYTYEQHKGMFSIDGRPNLLRVLDTMQHDLGIQEIVIRFESTLETALTVAFVSIMLRIITWIRGGRGRCSWQSHFSPIVMPV